MKRKLHKKQGTESHDTDWIKGTSKHKQKMRADISSTMIQRRFPSEVGSQARTPRFRQWADAQLCTKAGKRRDVRNGKAKR